MPNLTSPPTTDHEPENDQPQRLFDLEEVAHAAEISLSSAVRLARNIPPRFVHGADEFYDEAALELFRSRAADLPKPLPRLPGSRWRMKVCEVCTSTYDPPGPASKWCSQACREIGKDEKRASDKAGAR